jgi:Holliday junction resolvase RusA-like endonuclease
MISFTVPGIPMSRGSKRAIVNRHTGRAAMVDSCKASGEWMTDVKWYATLAHDGPPLAVPVLVRISFTLPRPRGHYRTGNRAAELRPDAPTWHGSKPDTDKLIRGCLDAMSGVVLADDRYVARIDARKVYGERPGALIEVIPIED